MRSRASNATGVQVYPTVLGRALALRAEAPSRLVRRPCPVQRLGWLACAPARPALHVSTRHLSFCIRPFPLLRRSVNVLRRTRCETIHDQRRCARCRYRTIYARASRGSASLPTGPAPDGRAPWLRRQIAQAPDIFWLPCSPRSSLYGPRSGSDLDYSVRNLYFGQQ